MKPLRNGSSWKGVNGVLEDKTRSGKPKRRLAHSMEKQPFSVKFRFTHSQYCEFREWWSNVCFFGVESFKFKKIDDIKGNDAEYRVVANSAPSYSNPSGDYVECSMEWEEV